MVGSYDHTKRLQDNALHELEYLVAYIYNSRIHYITL